MNWQYKTWIPTTFNLEDRLNQLGKEGWELVAVSSENIFVFKRAL